MHDILRENKRLIVISTYIVVLFIALSNFKAIIDFLVYLLDVFNPLFVAIAMAFVLNLPMMQFEKLLNHVMDKKKHKGLIRTLSILLTILFAIILLIVLNGIIIPKVAESMEMVFTNFKELVNNSIQSIANIIEKLGINYDIYSNSVVKSLENNSWTDIFSNWITTSGSAASGSIITNMQNFAGTFMNWFLSFCLSLYMLGSKEKLLRQLRKVCIAFLNKKHYKELFSICSQANGIFRKFVGGQLVNCCMLGIIMYITYRIMGIPFPELNAAILAVLAIIPVFGSIAAMVISFILIFAFNPTQAIWFIVVFQVVTNIESNILYPKVVGNSIGLPALWVLLSIFVLGGIYGVAGMLLAVPCTALVYSLFADFVNKTVKKKKKDKKLDKETIKMIE